MSETSVIDDWLPSTSNGHGGHIMSYQFSFNIKGDYGPLWYVIEVEIPRDSLGPRF